MPPPQAGLADPRSQAGLPSLDCAPARCDFNPEPGGTCPLPGIETLPRSAGDLADWPRPVWWHNDFHEAMLTHAVRNFRWPEVIWTMRLMHHKRYTDDIPSLLARDPSKLKHLKSQLRNNLNKSFLGQGPAAPADDAPENLLFMVLLSRPGGPGHGQEQRHRSTVEE